MRIQSRDVADDAVGDMFVEREIEQTSQVLSFVDASTGLSERVNYVRNPIASGDATVQTELGDFLSRPVVIDSRLWSTSSVSGPLGTIIEPWFLFLNNSVITNKIRNYAFLRAKLCIKVIINATPFHYGLLRVAYEPSTNAANTGACASKIRSNPVTSLSTLVPLSQLPGGWVYPAENGGCEIHVPFFRALNWVPLTSSAEIRTLGTLRYEIAFPLSVASATASNTVTVNTYAWLEDVELSGSTAELALQAKDEYDGPISKTASAVAKVGQSLSSVPVIGKFARATQIGAGAIASIASMFGFTNTPVIDSVHGFMPLPGAHLASGEISTAVQKLTLDPKQELSVDPSLHGIDSTDEMVISNIARRESVLAVVGWDTTAVVGSMLFNANVSPMLFEAVDIQNAGVTVSTRVYHTPMSYLGMMFAHWRGDVIFTVDVICSKFHKGRLRIAWDPLAGSGATSLPENTVYTTILDIGKTTKASFRVPYHSAWAWLRTRGIARENWSPGSNLPCNPQFDNGTFMISVLTPLMSPITPANVGLKISVRAADNLEYANPRHLGEGPDTSPPSFFAVQAKDEVDIQGEEVSFGDTGSSHAERYSLNFGERIVSLRQLLHRYTLYDVLSGPANSATRLVNIIKSFTLNPRMYGYDPNGLSTALGLISGAPTTFNFTPTHPITYVAMMYGGVRGGVNFVSNISLDLMPYVGHLTVERNVTSAQAGNRNGGIVSTLNAGATSSAAARATNLNGTIAGTTGCALTNTQTNGTLSWQYPYMTQANFWYPDPSKAIVGNSADASNRDSVVMRIALKQAVANTTSDLLTVHTYAGTAPDFTCLWWLCCPTLDYYSSIPLDA